MQPKTTDLIVEILEHYCFEHRRLVPTGYVVETLRAAGVPTDALLDVYKMSIESKVSVLTYALIVNVFY